LSFAGQGVSLAKVRFSPALRPVNDRCGQGAKFPSARKNIFFRKEIFFLAEGNFSACARRFFALRKEAFFLPEGDPFSFGRREIFLPRKKYFPSLENELSYLGNFPAFRTKKWRLP